ncbi:MAG: glycosyltransferase [Crocinitomicaceae bacterium]|nr:glycosyltransferase [Crocinitomicaceae bacterium]
MANVLYLSYDGMTDPLGQSQVLPYLKELSKKGHLIHLVSFEKNEVFDKNKTAIADYCEKNGITWHPQSYTKKPPLLSTVKDIRKMQQLAFSLHAEYAFDIVHCRSYMAALVGLKLKKKKGLSFLFDMRGFWADERIEGGIWKMSNPIFKLAYGYFKRKELQFFNHADHIVSLTQKGKEEFTNWPALKHKSLSVSVIPCCVDLSLFDPAYVNPHQLRNLKRALNIQKDDFILGYVGSIGTWYMLDEMLIYFAALKKARPSAKFLFVTKEQPSNIIEMAQKHGVIKKDLLFASTTHAFVPLHIALFDFSIFFIRPSFSKKASSPTKQGEIMAMGVPVICNSGVGDTDEIVLKYKAGVVLSSTNSEDFIVNLNKDNYDKSRLIAGAKDYFSLEKGANAYHEIYKSLAQGKTL